MKNRIILSLSLALGLALSACEAEDVSTPPLAEQDYALFKCCAWDEQHHCTAWQWCDRIEGRLICDQGCY